MTQDNLHIKLKEVQNLILKHQY